MVFEFVVIGGDYVVGVDFVVRIFEVLFDEWLEFCGGFFVVVCECEMGGVVGDYCYVVMIFCVVLEGSVFVSDGVWDGFVVWIYVLCEVVV